MVDSPTPVNGPTDADPDAQAAEFQQALDAAIAGVGMSGVQMVMPMVQQALKDAEPEE